MKIGIIGGGVSGLIAAWALEQDHEVVLFEREKRLGGHAHTTYVTIDGRVFPVETGFEFFNATMFPHFTKLLRLLNIRTEQQPLTYSFYSASQQSRYTSQKPLVLPPIRGMKLFFNTLTPSRIPVLLQFLYIIQAGKNIIKRKDTSVTLEQFLKNLWLTDHFRYDVFLSIFASGWGVSVEEFKGFAAYNILCWMICNHTMGFSIGRWDQVVEGTTRYIEALVNDITRTTFHMNTQVSAVTYDGAQYTIHYSDGKQERVDHLIIATNAREAAHFLKDIPSANMLARELEKIDYVHARITVHGDRQYMPTEKRNWSVANAWKINDYTSLTICKYPDLSTPLLRSWILPGFPEPRSIYSDDRYFHAKPTVEYYRVQDLMRCWQGINNLWIAGVYTQDIDSHESALNSALDIVKQIAPISKRLHALIDER